MHPYILCITQSNFNHESNAIIEPKKYEFYLDTGNGSIMYLLGV